MNHKYFRSLPRRIKQPLIRILARAKKTFLAAVLPYKKKPWTDGSLIRVNHIPSNFSRRSADFTANICGYLAPQVTSARYKLNHLGWQYIKHLIPRVPPPLFSIELSAAELASGMNRLVIEASDHSDRLDTLSIDFRYDPSPVIPPITVDWTAPPDVQDGYWTKVIHKRIAYVRPVPETENYDRIVAVTGAFLGGRRVELDVIFRSSTRDGLPFGFGILPLWGGRPDKSGVTPRGGWNFSLAWYYSHYSGVGSEFSFKFGDAEPMWVSSYRSFALEEDEAYHLTVEVWPELDSSGKHLSYCQRLKWESAHEKQSEWIELWDAEGSPLSPAEYAVAIIAHRCLADFGPVTVTPIRAKQIKSLRDNAWKRSHVSGKNA